MSSSRRALNLLPAFAFTRTAPSDRDTQDARRSRELVGTLLSLVSSSSSSAPEPSAAPEPGASSAPLRGGEAPPMPSGAAPHTAPERVRELRASRHALPSHASDAMETTRGEAAVAHTLLSPRPSTPFLAALAHDDHLPSLEQLDTLPAAALPAVVADLAARQAQLAALQARAAARLATMPAVASASDPRIAPGQRLSAQQLAERMGRSVDYVYRHADDWPFTVREGRSVTFDEAGFVRWQNKRTAANGMRRREVP